MRWYRDFSCPRLSFPRTNSPYGELSFPRLFVPGNFRSPGTKVPWNFRSRALSFLGNESSLVPRNLSFLRLFYKALAMNTDSYSNCQNLFRSRPSSVCFPKNKLSKFKVCSCDFFSVKEKCKMNKCDDTIDKLTLIRPIPQVFCAQWHSYRHIRDRRAAKAGRPTYNVSWEVHNGVNIIRVKSQPNMQ